ncbi:MAG TPA: sigma-70 family RNA polymerase sigma factor [Solirubrobacteraceae bacterium]|nr:sigma-70 family RNA polymerase sigma factor [Solirubrobacteraceae bacterium]
MAGEGLDPTVAARFAELRSSGSVSARAELIERHLPLARSLARRYRYTPEPRDDLEQVASLALVKAVDGFDPSRGSSFAAYAVVTIVGELKRHMRDTTWAVHVPRALKERILAVERAERTLSARLGGAPTVAALAAEAGVSEEQALEALNARGAHDAVPFDPGSQAEPAGEFSEAVEDRLVLSSAVSALPRRERTILRLRFVEGLTQTEIANRVGLSQMYVSRLLRATLESLRNEIESG